MTLTSAEKNVDQHFEHESATKQKQVQTNVVQQTDLCATVSQFDIHTIDTLVRSIFLYV